MIHMQEEVNEICMTHTGFVIHMQEEVSEMASVSVAVFYKWSHPQVNHTSCVGERMCSYMYYNQTGGQLQGCTYMCGELMFT